MIEVGQNPETCQVPSTRRWWIGAWPTFVAIVVIELCSRFVLKLTSPGPILMLTVVYSAFTGGTLAGLVASVMVLAYDALFVYRMPRGFHSTEQIVRLCTLAVVVPTMAVLVGFLRRRAEMSAAELSLRQSAARFRTSVQQSADALRRNEARYRSLIEATAQIVWTVSGNGEVMEDQPTWRAFTGQSFEQMKDRGWTLAIHPDDWPRVKQIWRDSSATLLAHENDFRVRRADGEWREMHSRAVPVFGPDGKIREWVGTLSDVTEQRRAQSALAEAEERVRMAVQSANVGTWDWDLRKDELRFSDRCKIIFGLPIDAPLTYEIFVQHLHSDDRARTIDVVERVLAPSSDGNYELEYRIIWPDGSIHWISARGHAFFEGEGASRRPVRFTGTALDTTDRKESELNIRRAKEEAESANRAKDQFLAALSHELRTPLTPVLLTATTLENDSTLSPKLRDDLALIRRNVELEARLIDDLLDLTRIARGKLQLDRRILNPAICVHAALEVCQDDLVSKGLKLRLTDSPDARFVLADPARLQQIFWNLIKNSVKFTPSGGEVRIICEDVGDRYRVTVSDTGIGIDPEILPRIFDAFEQGADLITRQFGGLGMGLAISKALIDLHEGTLIAQSGGKNQGATFVMELPTVPARAIEPPAAPPQQSSADLRSLRILLVEDHDATSRVLAMLLRQLKHEVTAAATVADALRHADGGQFDLLISDLGLPDGSGLDLMRELREKFNLAGICLSGYGMDQDIRRSREAGFAQHLTKPVDFRRLKATIQSVVG